MLLEAIAIVIFAQFVGSRFQVFFINSHNKQKMQPESLTSHFISSKTLETIPSNQSISREENISSSNPLSVSFANSVSPCPKHNLNKDILCLTDSTLICCHCAIFDLHREHIVMTVSQIQEEVLHLKEQLERINHYSCEGMHERLMGASQEGRKKIEQRKIEMMKQVKLAYVHLYAEIQKQEKGIYQKINQFCEGEIEKLEQQIGEILGEYKEKGEEIIQKWKVNGDNLFDYEPYLKRLKVSMEGSVSLSNFKKDLEGQLTAIQNLSFEKVSKAQIAIQDTEKILRNCGQYISLCQEGDNKSEISLNKSQSQSHLFSKKCRGDCRRSHEKQERASLGLKNQSPYRKYESKEVIQTPLIALTNSSFFRGPNIQRVSAIKGVQTLVNSFISDPCKDTLELSNSLCSNLRELLPSLLQKVTESRSIPRLKLSRIGLSDQHLRGILPFANSCQYINLSHNELSEHSLLAMIEYFGSQVDRTFSININMSRNKLIESSRLVKDRINALKHTYGINVII